MTSRVLREALRIAQNALPNHPQYRYYIHYSFIVVKNSIVVVGMNRSGEPPVYYGYHRRVEKPKTHSELDAYAKYRTKGVPFEMINVRLQRSGHMRLAKPCYICAGWLASTACTQLVYSTGSGWERLIWGNKRS